MNRYPTEEELKYIREFDLPDKPVSELLDFIEQIWEYGDLGFIRSKHKLVLHTYGWSGNEDIIEALMQNFLFWALYWSVSKRGGHYYFNDSSVSKESKGFLRYG